MKSHFKERVAQAKGIKVKRSKGRIWESERRLVNQGNLDKAPCKSQVLICLVVLKKAS